MEPVKKFPRFFDCDGVFVKVDLDPETDEVFGMNSWGKPWPPIKARSIGEEITEEEFNRRVKRMKNE